MLTPKTTYLQSIAGIRTPRYFANLPNSWKRYARTCDEMDISIDIDLRMDEAPVPMNAEQVAALTVLCETEQLNYRIMHSGAGHDAQISRRASLPV